MKLLWSVFTDGNWKTLARSIYVCEWECKIDNAKDLFWLVHLLPWLFHFDRRSWDDSKSRAGPDICLASSVTNGATDMSSITVTLSLVVLSTFRFNLLIYTLSLDVHALGFFFLVAKSVDDDHNRPTVNKKACDLIMINL